MALRSQPMVDVQLTGRTVFLSASIPDPSRWDGDFDAHEITDAVVAASRAVLTSGGTLVTAAHPTIAPLLLYVAGEFPRENNQPASVITYQSSLFEDVLPEATRRFQESGIGDFRFTDAVPGEEPVPGRSDQSLLLMREQMFSETSPVAAIFVGGMDGVRDEYELLSARHPQPFAYPIRKPGGEAARLTPPITSEIAQALTGDVYPSVFRAVIADLVQRLD
jgi:SLOG cluster3 family